MFESKAAEELLESLNEQIPSAKVKIGAGNAGLDDGEDLDDVAVSKELQQFMTTTSTATAITAITTTPARSTTTWCALRLFNDWLNIRNS
jgi:hypothetical protein